MLRTFLIVFCLATTACHKVKAPTASVPKPDPRVSVDLEPGWRVRVITPLIVGGGYKAKLKPVKGGDPFMFETGEDFLGFETAYYAVTESRKPQFTSADLTRDGKTAPQPKPLHPLFSKAARHVRLVYLERGSSSEHDMAIVSARKLTALEALTSKARANQCQSGCEWVPAGIAVRAEKQNGGVWIPAH